MTAKNIVVVGGGTAGWMSALMAKQVYPTAHVTVVESSDIGILGAGEGTTPHFVDFLDYVGVAITDLIKETGITFKTAIKFSNWNGDGGSYYHPFDSIGDLDPFRLHNGLLVDTALATKTRLDVIVLAAILEDSKRIPATFHSSVGRYGANPIESVNFLANWGIHFDATKMATALARIGVSRGIKRVDAEVVRCDVSGAEVKTLWLSSGKHVPVNFLFDCTGFARKFFGGALGATWESFSSFLPMKKAVPFFIPHDNDVSPKTDAIAMQYGWAWKIPVQDRYGCGYVFDSDYITAEEALAEASEYFGVDIKSERVFEFSPGCYREAVIGNCMAVGLSQGFVEPLEATSLMTSFLNLRSMLEFGLFAKRSESAVAKFNDTIFERNVAVAHFLHLHYLTSRDDSPFWREFKERNSTPQEVEDLMNNFASGRCLGTWQTVFPVQSWTYVLAGLGHAVPPNETFVEAPPAAKEVVANQRRMANTCATHSAVLSFLRGETHDDSR
jgi:tryptophan 7-halogenase